MRQLIESMYINGEVVNSDEVMAIYNPANTKEIVGNIAIGNAEHANVAIESAHAAWKLWSKIIVNERAVFLEKAAKYIENHLDELTRLLVTEHGKTYDECVADVKGGANTLRYYSSLKEELNKDQMTINSQGKMILNRQSMGVTSVIVPWNGPIVLCFLMLAPSLMAGNTAVIKPSMYCPLTLTKILKEIGSLFPKGVINIVTGSGGSVGTAMVTHPKVRKVAFTGSTETGRVIMRNAAGTIKSLSMELGGNDAAIVLGDAVLDEKNMTEIVKGVFTMCGQICYGIKRIYVSKVNYQEFVEKFIAVANTIKVGHGLHPETTMGPLNNKAQYEKVKKIIGNAEKSGAKVRTVGSLVEGVSLSEGYYIMPTIVTDIEEDAEVVQEEQFGPVIPILPFNDVDEVIELVNDTEFGLGNSIWTKDVDKGFELARSLHSGSVFINVHRMGASAVNMPFGGFKQSGLGRGHGIEGLYEHTELQAIIKRDDM